MNLTEQLKKDYWLRRVTALNGGVSFPTLGLVQGYQSPIQGANGVYFRKLTQDDFLNEIQPTAHRINGDVQFSRREIWQPTGQKDDEGKDIWEFAGYDDMETICLGLQYAIKHKKVSHFAADGFWTSCESKDKQELHDTFSSWLDSMGIKYAYTELIDSLFSTADGAILPYIYNGALEYKIFSYLKGDVLYPDIDDEGNPMLYRKYTIDNRSAIDVFTTRYHDTYIQITKDSKEDENFLTKFAKRIKNAIKGTVITDDGYKLVSRKESQTNNTTLQVVYFRISDIPSGVAQDSIDGLERSYSYIANEVKSSAFPILFVKSQSMKSLPPSDINGKTIGVTGTADTIQYADAKYLTPPDASNIATLHNQSLMDNIVKSTLSVFISPDILKSGADSSATMKILFTPEIQWCQTMFPQIFPQLKQLVEVLKQLVGKLEGKTSAYTGLRISVGQNIWIPQNEKESAEIIRQNYFARLISREAAMTELGNIYIGDAEKIMQEWEQELKMKAEIPLKAKREYGEVKGVEVVDNENNPAKPAIDNNMSGKSILE